MQYLGILLGALYGLGFRMLCENAGPSDIYDYYDIYSVTFIWVVPIIVAIIPILFARNEILKSRWKQFFFPIFSVILFFLFALSSGLEDWLCILIIAFPFLLSAGLVGLLLGSFIKNRKSNKLYSIVFLPLLLNPLEVYLPNSQETYSVKSEIIINAHNEMVWNNLIEVPEIKADEYNYGFYNYIGVPRPIKSELEIIDGEEYRIGYFTEGLKLYETISEIDTFKFVNFKIHIDKSELRDTPTDKHLLQSDYFKFKNIAYSLLKLKNGRTKLTLNCDYILNSKMNFYANYWAERIIKDFEEKLLEVLKAKIESELVKKH
ncbi:MAG: hypothetical protein GQ574_07180 [Crocinitomix sp.]|nr:hypothetical protein [Crocinitomix sp.]